MELCKTQRGAPMIYHLGRTHRRLMVHTYIHTVIYHTLTPC